MSSDPWTILGIPQSTWMSGSFVPTPAQWDTLFVYKADASSLASYATTAAVAANYAPLNNPTFTGKVTLPGVNDASNAAATVVGEFVSAFVLVANALAMTTATPTDILSLSLSPGDWDVQGNGLFTGSALPTLYSVWLNTVSATFPTASANGMPLNLMTVTMTGPSGGPTGQLRVNVSAPTPVYLTAQGNFASGTMAGYGAITARRMR